MMWRLVREDVEGMADFPWTRETQHEFKLNAQHVKQLEAGQIVHTRANGGTEWYLLEEGGPTTSEPTTERITCPMCGGSGQITSPKYR